jgi:hypothetical protein
MKYDSDLRWVRRIVWGLIALNLILAFNHARVHEWLIAFACGVWALNCSGWLRMLKAQQKTRDQGRLIESALLGVLSGELDKL